MNVYLVFDRRGSCNDLCALFKTWKAADEYANIRNEREYRDAKGYVVETWELADDISECILPDFYEIYVSYNFVKNKIEKIMKCSCQYRYGQRKNMDIVWEKIENKSIFCFCIFISYKHDVQNPITDDRLLKIAQDRWAQFKARKEGIG